MVKYKSTKTRITIIAYDQRSFDQIIRRPLQELVDASKETGQCLLVYNNDIQTYIEKTKAGYKISTYDRRNLSNGD